MRSASPVYLCPGPGGHGTGSRREEAVEKPEKSFRKVGSGAQTLRENLMSMAWAHC